MLRWWMLGVILVAGCDPPSRSCGQGALGVRLVDKALIVGAFVHRIESVETLEGDYEPPPPSDEWAPAEATIDENFWLAERGDAVIVVRVIDHVALTEGMCGPLFDRARPWSERPFARLDPAVELGAPLEIVDATLAYREPVSSVPESLTDDWEYPLTADDDQLGFTLRADYYVEPAGCDDSSCSSTVRLTHHFRRP